MALSIILILVSWLQLIKTIKWDVFEQVILLYMMLIPLVTTLAVSQKNRSGLEKFLGYKYFPFTFLLLVFIPEGVLSFNYFNVSVNPLSVLILIVIGSIWIGLPYLLIRDKGTQKLEVKTGQEYRLLYFFMFLALFILPKFAPSLLVLDKPAFPFYFILQPTLFLYLGILPVVLYSRRGFLPSFFGLTTAIEPGTVKDCIKIGLIIILLGVFPFKAIKFNIVEITVTLTGMLYVAGMEEIFYRGFVLNFIIEKFKVLNKGKELGIVLSSLFFAMTHWVDFNLVPFYRNAPKLFILIFMGLLYARLYLKTKSLLPGIILHAVYNTIVSISR